MITDSYPGSIINMDLLFAGTSLDLGCGLGYGLARQRKQTSQTSANNVHVFLDSQLRTVVSTLGPSFPGKKSLTRRAASRQWTIKTASSKCRALPQVIHLRSRIIASSGLPGLLGKSSQNTHWVHLFPPR